MVSHIEDSFKSDVFGVEKENVKVDGILAAVYQSVFGGDVYPSLEEMCIRDRSGSGKHESIKVFDKKFSKNVPDIYLLSQKDVGKEENLLLKPFYLMPFLIEQEYVRNDKI